MDATTELLTISEAAALLDVSPQTLRRWEQKGHIAPVRTPGGQRRYTRDQLHAVMIPAEPTEKAS